MSTITYSVRIISNAEELAKAFRLRYRIYKIAYPKGVEALTEDFETDVYDLRSVHLGLYAESNEIFTLVGYTRLVIPQAFASKFSDVLFRQHAMYRIHGSGEQPEKIAMMNGITNAQYKEAINKHCLDMESNNEVYCEISRFIIDNNHRSLSLATFFVTGITTICHSLRIARCLIICDPHHTAFYKRFGLTPMREVNVFLMRCFGKRVVICGAVIEALRLIHKSVDPFKVEFSKQRSITLQKAA